MPVPKGMKHRKLGSAKACAGDTGYYHEQADFWDRPLCWRRAYNQEKCER